MRRLLSLFQRAQGIVGHLDDVESRTVRGWAALKGKDQKLTVQLEIDDVIVAEAVADSFRPDLQGVISSSGCHGFTIRVPDANLDGSLHKIAVLVKNTNVRLTSKITQSQLPPDNKSLPVPRHNYAGHVDEISDGVVRGWAADLNYPAANLVVEVLVDGEIASSSAADLFRGDIAALGLSSGYHGFVCKIPSQYRDGRSHNLTIKIHAADHVISTASRILARGKELPSHTAPAFRKLVKTTMIMPTYNRGPTMEATIRRFLPCLARAEAELVVIDDGSRDDTRERLKTLASQNSSIRFESIPNGGPALARNKAANIARGSLLLFVGDDTAPVDDEFILFHQAAHARFDKRGQAVLGKITWPDKDDFDVSFVMKHIQGDGQQQFGYNFMTPYAWYRWNLFYSSNISVKKDIVDDWEVDGFQKAFYLAAFEDPEFGLRVTKRLELIGEKFEILYVPTARLTHHHKYDVEGFIRRQVATGMMAHEFLKLHPGMEEDLGLAELVRRLKLPLNDGRDFPVEHYMAIFEGLRSWVIMIDNHYGLGSQNWHGDLLKCIFQLSFYEGYMRAQTTSINLASGSRYILESLRVMLNRAIVCEMLGELPGFGVV